MNVYTCEDDYTFFYYYEICIVSEYQWFPPLLVLFGAQKANKQTFQ